MQPKEISIEYAHIYTNNKIGEEHSLSLKILAEVKGDKEDRSLVVMVDDYFFQDNQLHPPVELEGVW
jgi:hypothetical protein